MNKLLLVIALTLLPLSAMAQTAAQVVPGYLTTVGCPGGLTACFVPSSPSTALVGSQEGVSLASATALTLPTGATRAVISVEGTNNTAGQCARWRDDGTNPTGSAGIPLAANTIMHYQVTSLPIKLIEATGATCTMNVAYYL